MTIKVRLTLAVVTLLVVATAATPAGTGDDEYRGTADLLYSSDGTLISERLAGQADDRDDLPELPEIPSPELDSILGGSSPCRRSRARWTTACSPSDWETVTTGSWRHLCARPTRRSRAWS